MEIFSLFILLNSFLQCTRLTEIKNLDELTELTDLYLSENGIVKIQGLDNNKKLTTLDLAMNKITLIENVSHLTELEEFWVSFAQKKIVITYTEVYIVI